MKIRIVSDLHVDGAAFTFTKPCLDEVLVVAGDTANSLDGMVEFIESIHHLFKAVVVIKGNHEGYHGDTLDAFNMRATMYFEPMGNVFFLDGNSVKIDDVTFIGATLWTTFRGEDVVAMMTAKRGIMDFGRINLTFGVRVTPEWMVKECKTQLGIIRETCKTVTGKKVVVTHFPMITEYQDPKYGTMRENPLNAYFINDFEHEIMDLEFDLAIAGHTHSAADFMKHGKRFIANPRGYCYRGVAENDKWNKDLVVEI